MGNGPIKGNQTGEVLEKSDILYGYEFWSDVQPHCCHYILPGLSVHRICMAAPIMCVSNDLGSNVSSYNGNINATDNEDSE